MTDPSQLPFLLLPRVKRFVPLVGRGAVQPVRRRLVEPGAIAGAGSNPEAYRLRLDASGAAIEGSTDAATRHGLATLAQIERQFGPRPPGCLIEDWPAFPTRGLMLDISRDRVPTNGHLAHIVDTLAALKFNHFQLYTEHTFAYEGHREVWEEASPLTPEEARALDRYARQRGVELAPNQNCFGHLASWLRHPKYAHLAETHGDWSFENAGRSFKRSGPFSLCPLDPGSIELVRDLLSQLLPCFHSPLVNIGCDETFDIGSGRSKEEVSRRGRAAVYFDFVRQVVDAVAGHGRRAMMWADIALSQPESIGLIPEGVIGLVWGYEPDAPFGEWVARLREAGREAWVCPGTSTWRSITGRTSERRANLLRAASEGAEAGATGYLVTEWGDMGHRQQWPISLHAIAEAGDAAWSGANAIFDSRAVSLHAFDDRSLAVAPWINALGDADLELRRVGGAPGPGGERRALRNASSLFTDLHAPFEEVPGEAAPEPWERALNQLRLLRSHPAGLASPLLTAELAHTLRVATLAAEQALARRCGGTPKKWRLLADEARAVLEEHATLWAERSRPGGLSASSRHYEEVYNRLHARADLAATRPAPARSPRPGEGPRLIAGCMTGTSIDSLDAALVRIRGRGLAMKAEVVRTLTRPLGELAPALRRIAEQQPLTAGQIATVSRDFSLLHLSALKGLLAGDAADLVSIHGQTIFHAPPVSWQLLTPAIVAHGLGIPVVSDLRAADLAAGGQGAPITPIADWIMFSSSLRGSAAVVNLGGFCNVTILAESGPDKITGRDVCACNHILDRIARTLLGRAFDEDGRCAAAGAVHPAALADLSALLLRQGRAGRSLGTGDEVDAWLGTWSEARPSDLAATACDAIASVIGRAVGHAGRVLLAGGGAKNAALARAIAARCAAPVQSTAALGVPPDYREAIAMAVLGGLCQDRVPITLSQVTGVPGPAPIAGVWAYP
jgi:1,6-anhydro-N-acetylmuramate kinase